MPPHIETCVVREGKEGGPPSKLEPFLELCVATEEPEKQTEMGVSGNHMKDRRPGSRSEKIRHEVYLSICDKPNVLKAQ